MFQRSTQSLNRILPPLNIRVLSRLYFKKKAQLGYVNLI